MVKNKMFKSAKYACLVSLLCLGVTGCGGKGAEETVADTVADTYMDTESVVDDYGDGLEDEESSEDPGQKLTVSLVQDNVEEEAGVVVPVAEFKKYGKVVKGKDGYRILAADGHYVSDSLLSVGENHFYFDEDGYMKDDVFVPTKNASGEIIAMQFDRLLRVLVRVLRVLVRLLRVLVRVLRVVKQQKVQRLLLRQIQLLQINLS